MNYQSVAILLDFSTSKISALCQPTKFSSPRSQFMKSDSRNCKKLTIVNVDKQVTIKHRQIIDGQSLGSQMSSNHIYIASYIHGANQLSYLSCDNHTETFKQQFMSDHSYFTNNILSVSQIAHLIYQYGAILAQPPSINNLMLSNLTEMVFATNFLLNIKEAKMLLDKTYQYPARYQDAMVHRKANKLGFFPKESDMKNDTGLEVCPCCNNKAIREDFPICYQTYYREEYKDIHKNQLPEGVVNFFCFAKMAILYLLLRFLIMDIYLMYAGFWGSYCRNYAVNHDKHYCYIKISPYNLKSIRDQGELNNIDILVLVYNLISIVFFLTFRIFMNKQQRLYSPVFFEDSQYTVLLENIPSFLYEQRTRLDQVNPQYQKAIKKAADKKISEWLCRIKQKQRNGEELQFLQKQVLENIIKHSSMADLRQTSAVVAVSICYDLNELENINKLRDQLIEEYSGTDQNQSDQSKQFLSHIPNQITQLNNMFIDLNINFLNPIQHSNGFKLTHFTGKAFVSFNYQHYRDYFINQYQNNTDFFQISRKSIKVSYANKASDVNWYNMKISDSERDKYKLFTTAVLIMLLIIAFASHFFMHRWRVQLAASVTAKTINSFLGTFLTFSQSILIGLLNMILSAFIQFLSRLQKHKTESDLQYSMAGKTIIAQTLNTIVIYAIVYIIYPVNPLSMYGIANTIFNLVMVIGIANVITSLIMPSHWFWQFVRYFCLFSSDTANMFQVQYNQLLQLPAFTYNNAYSFYIIYTFVVSFYGYIAPWTSSVLLLIFFAQYWLDKFNLFKRYSYSIDIGYKYSQLMISNFELSMLFFAISHYLWDSQIHFAQNFLHKFINIIGVLVVILYIIFKKKIVKMVEKRILKRKKVINIYSYRQKIEEPYNMKAKLFCTENPAHKCFKNHESINHLSQKNYHSLNEELIN